MRNTKNKKVGRKPLPENKKKKRITCMVKSDTFQKLEIDTLNGKAESPTLMAAKILERYYKKIEEKEKNKVKEENMTDKKAA